MAERDPAWAQSGSYAADEDRGVLAAIFGARHFTDLSPEVSKVDAGGGHGVVGSGDLAVSAGSGHSVDVAAGQAVVRGTQQGDQGVYVVSNDASENVAIATPDATNDRIDLIQARVTDTDYGAGATAFLIDAKTGTPAASPSAPTPDENALVLAQVLVPAAAASSANYTITDKRTRAAAVGGTITCTSTTRPTSASTGQLILETDTGLQLRWTGSAWRYLPGQTLGYAEVTASQTGLGTTSDITGLAVTYNAYGFPVKVKAKMRIIGVTAASAAVLRIREATTTLDDAARLPAIGISESGILVGETGRITLSDASHTVKVTYVGTAGNPTMSASSTDKAYIEVVSA